LLYDKLKDRKKTMIRFGGCNFGQLATSFFAD